MVKKLKDENQEFAKSWEEIQKKGFFNYFRTKIVSVGAMMLLIYIISILFSKNTNYIMSAIIHIGITVFAPIFSWKINELRYKRYRISKH